MAVWNWMYCTSSDRVCEELALLKPEQVERAKVVVLPKNIYEDGRWQTRYDFIIFFQEDL